MNEPIADAARSILDGHVVLTRELAHANHYPAIDVLQSVSRLQGEVSVPEVKEAAGELRSLMAAYKDKRDLIAIGAYERGSDPVADRAIDLNDRIEGFLKQRVDEPTPGEQADQMLLELIGGGSADQLYEVLITDEEVSPSGPRKLGPSVDVSPAIPPLNLGVG